MGYYNWTLVEARQSWGCATCGVLISRGQEYWENTYGDWTLRKCINCLEKVFRLSTCNLCGGEINGEGVHPECADRETMWSEARDAYTPR